MKGEEPFWASIIVTGPGPKGWDEQDSPTKKAEDNNCYETFDIDNVNDEEEDEICSEALQDMYEDANSGQPNDSTESFDSFPELIYEDAQSSNSFHEDRCNGEWLASCNEDWLVALTKETEEDRKTTFTEVEFPAKSFRERHYFYNYVRLTVENSCHETAMKSTKGQIADREWCRCRLKSNTFYQMADKEWSKPGQIEIDGWSFFSETVGLPGTCDDRKKAFSCLNFLRQAAVHRRHGSVSKGRLETAMSLPTILGDDVRASEIRSVYHILLQDPCNRKEEDQALVDKVLYTPNEYPILIPELLHRIQQLLEHSAFAYAKEADPIWLEEHKFTVSEQIELQQYYLRWDGINHQVGPHPDVQVEDPCDNRTVTCEWYKVLSEAKELRNEATHRSYSTDPEASTVEILRDRVEWAQRFARMVGDEEQAERIESIAEEWFRKYRPVVEGEEKVWETPVVKGVPVVEGFESVSDI